MKLPLVLSACAGALILTGCAASGGGYSYDGRVYSSREECLAAKRSAKTKGAIVGAVGGAAAGAVLGGNVGESALAGGAGALGGYVLSGRNTPC